MKPILLPLLLIACACDRRAHDSAPAPAPAPAPAAVIDNVAAAQSPQSKNEAIVPMPKDQAQLDRMILAGYTPHGSHLHPPGVKECPLAQGSDVVM